MAQGITPGRAYRAYRFPHRAGGRLSRRFAARPVSTFAGALTAVLLAGAAFAGFAAAATIGYFAADLPAAHDLATVPVPLTTHIYDRTGEHLLYTLADERRDLISIDAVPKRMQDATIAIEDKTFWSNPGIDVGGIVRAFQANAASGRITQGGSTITQQLIKTRLLGDDPTFTRKIKEAILAMEATRTFSKKQILEMYFNQIYYGNQAYGLKAAAATYFGVFDLNKLTLGQMALLAGLPQAPSDYDPIQNVEGAKARRAQVLDAMVENNYATEAEAAAANGEAIAVKPATTSLYAPHFTFRVREQLVQVLGEKAAYRGGYDVYTTLDWNMQQLAEKEVREHVDGLKGFNVNNAALITMDPTTGEVLAYVGSYDYYARTAQVQGDYDHAGIALRQPGSTFKLFTYLAGMQKIGLTASSRLYDIEFRMPDGIGKFYAPKDATKEQHGPVTLRQALRESLNLPALQVTRMVGVDAIIDTVHQLGINRDWDRSRIGLSFGIGAGEMRLIDMASAYQVVANMGVRVEPTMIYKIVDPSGTVVKDFASKPEGRRVLDQRQAWIFADILKDNTNPQGSFVFGPWTSIGRPAALKTGTTDELQDVLAIGFTPQRLTAIWMGNSDNSEMRGITSAMGPGVLWRDYMKTVVGGLPATWYDRPAGIVDRVVCVNPSLLGGNGSGELPGPGCPGGFRMTEKFVEGTEPRTDDRFFYTSCGINLRAPFADWQAYYNVWASGAVSGKFSYGRFSWQICGFTPKPSESPSPSPGATSPPPGRTPQPTQPPRPTKKP
ncbi:MAG TPA: transglycosylase domain-containing protein [Candidatus Limnocylindria bacterium]|jgi:membrane peptidoglycan carboxypeptidase|nr:transglycosylase domain-containing protein [Candidatus Limnocylindria bacterium]